VGAARYAHCMLVQSPSSCSAASWILSSNLSRIVPSFVAMVTCVAKRAQLEFVWQPPLPGPLPNNRVHV